MNEDRAGGSAQAEYERRLANHKADLRRRRSTILTVGAAFVIVGLYSAATGSTVGWMFVALGIAIPVIVLFSTPQSIEAWATGAEGEPGPAASSSSSKARVSVSSTTDEYRDHGRT